jgi:hypothetical protein
MRFAHLCVFFFSLYSNEPKGITDRIKKDPSHFVSTNDDEPKFECKYKGRPSLYSRKQTERMMSPLYWMSLPLFVDGVFAGACYMRQGKTFLRKHFTLLSAGLLLINGMLYLEMKKFRNQAGPWLQALKEKESENKLSLNKNA